MTNINPPSNSLPADEAYSSQSIYEMKKFILKQIQEITEAQINIMENHEIVLMYKQLLSQACPETQSEKRDQPHCDKNQKEDSSNKNTSTLQTIQNHIKNTYTNQINQLNLPQKSKTIKRKPLNKIQIKGQFYRPPYTLNSESYMSSSKKFQIVCKPEPQLIQAKRKLISSVLGPTMASTVKSFKKQQITETYANLKVINRRQMVLTQNDVQQKQYQPKQFIVFVKKMEISEQQRQKLRQHDKKQQNLTKQPIIYSSSNSQQNENKQKQIFDHSQQPQNAFIQSDQFFNQFLQQKKQIVDKVETESKKIETRVQQKPLIKQALKVVENKQPTPTMKQTLKMAKQKRFIENSAQTDKIGVEGGRKKLKLVVISQTQYIEDNDDQEICSVRRTRNQEQNSDESYGIPLKMKGDEMLEKLLLSSGNWPNPQILKWFSGMKKTLMKLQYQYMKQFQSNWNHIE